MEVEAAVVMWRRSVAKFNLKYVTILCDGDAKTVKKLNDLEVYEETIVKEDCINHVAKRMWTGIEKLKQKLKGTPHSITGKGKVTEKVQKKLCNYYASALKDNAPNVKAMQRGVYASLEHMMSTDEKPCHKNCPLGPTSWCHYQRESATGEERRKHSPGIKKIDGDRLLELYARMSDSGLLERCTRMGTQNANECFNGTIWRRCPKEEPASLKTIETAVAMATLEFNGGSQAFGSVLQQLGIDCVGQNLELYMRHATIQRKRSAQRQSTPAAKTSRKRKKLVKAGLADDRNEREGVLYGSGCFND
jgi:hypothetical protein